MKEYALPPDVNLSESSITELVSDNRELCEKARLLVETLSSLAIKAEAIHHLEKSPQHLAVLHRISDEMCALSVLVRALNIQIQEVAEMMASLNKESGAAFRN